MSPEPPNFHFISVKGQNNVKDQTVKRQARSHAVKCGLLKKRKLQQSSGDNFRPLASTQKSTNVIKRRGRAKVRATTISPLFAGMLDPFQTLAVDSLRLQTLLGDCKLVAIAASRPLKEAYNKTVLDKARQAPEPVFSVAEELAFQNFRSVFRTGFVDPALLNAVMLSLVFATTGGYMDQECLVYQIQAISHIRQRINFQDDAASESTIGAVLLLAGIEARLGLAAQVQLHIGAVQLLLQFCQSKGVQLTSGIKRAIFWQDLNCSILTGSRRMVDHLTFTDLEWRRDSFPPNFFRLSTGFLERSYLLSKDLLEVLQDVQALQCVRDVFQPTKGDAIPMARINNHIASIQSRLAGLSSFSPIQECCRLAAYVCSMMLCCKVWCALVVPSHVASRLLQELQQTIEDPMWDDNHDLLLWLLYIGGAFVPPGTIRSEYAEILRSNNSIKEKKICKSWPQLLETLKRFIWSKSAFESQVKAFWEEVMN